LLGWRTVCAVEWEPYAASVLVQRQNDGILPPFPVWDDVQTFDGRPWRGIVDVVSGGFPCQDISAAGKGAGIDGERSGMWREMARIICEVRPRYVFVENSPVLTSRGLGQVLGDLASMGFDARWGVLGAADFSAPHQRDRIWIVADSNVQHVKWRPKPQQPASLGWQARNQSKRRGDEMGHACSSRFSQPRTQQTREDWEQSRRPAAAESWWFTEPDVGRVAHGVAARVDRLKAIGNGQVPAVAASAFALLQAGR